MPLWARVGGRAESGLDSCLRIGPFPAFATLTRNVTLGLPDKGCQSGIFWDKGDKSDKSAQITPRKVTKRLKSVRKCVRVTKSDKGAVLRVSGESGDSWLSGGGPGPGLDTRFTVGQSSRGWNSSKKVKKVDIQACLLWCDAQS